MARFSRTLAGCALVLVVLAGCSSSDDNKAASSTPTTAGGSTTSTAPPVNTSFSGQNSAQFCALAKTYNDRFSNVGFASTPAQLKSLTQDGRTPINQAVTRPRPRSSGTSKPWPTPSPPSTTSWTG